MTESYVSDRLPVSPDEALPLFAAAAMVAWVLLEFASRRGLGPLLAEPLGTSLGGDAVVMVFVVPVVAGAIAVWGTRAGVHRTDWDYETSLRSVGVGLVGFVAFAVVYVGLLYLLTSVLGIGLPATPGGQGGVDSPPTWAVALFFLGNGVAVPISEKLAWRGVIQTALTESYGTSVAIVVTALAFVAKHVIVDMGEPLFRLVALVVLAFVLCGLRARWGTTASTVAHLGVNLVATATVLVMV